MLVLQFAFLSPFLAFQTMLNELLDAPTMLWALAAIRMVSSMLCVYAIFGLITASHTILKQHNVHEKFLHKTAFADNGNSEPMFHIWRGVLSAPRSQRKATVFEDCFSRRIRCIYRHLSLLCCGHLFQEILSS